VPTGEEQRKDRRSSSVFTYTLLSSFRVNEAWFLKDGNLSNSGLWSTAMGAGGGVYDVGRDDDDDDEGASSSALDIEQGRPGQEDELMPQVGGSNDWVDEGAMQGRRRRRTGRGA